MHRLVIPSVFLFLLLAPHTGFAQTADEQAATQVAKQYLDHLKAGRFAEAVQDMWDVDAVLTSSFGLMYLDLPAAEKAATQRAFRQFFAAPFAAPKLARLFSTITLQNARAVSYPDSQVGVTLEIASSSEPFEASNTLLLRKTGDTWRIVDQRQGTSPPIRSAIVIMWAQGRKNPDTTLASILENAATQIQSQAAQQR